MNVLFIRRRREKCTVLCANYFRELVQHLTHVRKTSGFNNWKHAFNDWQHSFKAASQHKIIQEYRKCMITYDRRLKTSVPADTQLAIRFNNDNEHWKEVLNRIVAVIKFLASKGFP